MKETPMAAAKATILAVLLSATVVAAGAQPDPFARHTVAVTDHVWLIYRTVTSTEPPFEGNVVVFEQSGGLVVVDAGGCPRSGQNAVAEIRSISKKPVRYLVYTHYHGDHNLGAGAFRQAWPDVVIVSTARTRASMTGEPMKYVEQFDHDIAQMVDHARERLKKADLSPSLRRGWQHVADAGDAMVDAYRNLRVYPADLTFDQSLAIPDSDVPLEIRFLGEANTDGDAIVWAPRQRVVAAGDIVVNPVPYASASFPAKWVEVLAALKGLQYQKLIPGHGPVLSDTTFLDQLSAALSEVTDQVSKLAAEGESLDEIRQKVKLGAIAEKFSAGDDWDRARFGDFFSGSIVSNAYKEAKGQPIVQGQDGG
jgi:glyoxylase-like metal-dependent hydrolase (beta-lactamase superfamily II)